MTLTHLICSLSRPFLPASRHASQHSGSFRVRLAESKGRAESEVRPQPSQSRSRSTSVGCWLLVSSAVPCSSLKTSPSPGAPAAKWIEPQRVASSKVCRKPLASATRRDKPIGGVWRTRVGWAGPQVLGCSSEFVQAIMRLNGSFGGGHVLQLQL